MSYSAVWNLEGLAGPGVFVFAGREWHRSAQGFPGLGSPETGAHRLLEAGRTERTSRYGTGVPLSKEDS